MCPGSLLGSFRPHSRGQTQAVDWVYLHPKTYQNPKLELESEMGGTGMPHPQRRGSHCGGLSPSTGWGLGRIEVQPLMQSPPVAAVVPGSCTPCPGSGAPALCSPPAVPCLLT